ncbi:MAG: response regulator [Thermodesulfobacteriota bacterium]
MKKILIVDDDSDVRALLEKTLMKCGCAILTAADGQQALAIARDEHPDLIIMDIMMPGTIDGIEATRILKADLKTRRSNVIVLTGMGVAEIRGKVKNAGAASLFQKPFSPLELLDAIEGILGRTCPGGSP